MYAGSLDKLYELYEVKEGRRVKVEVEGGEMKVGWREMLRSGLIPWYRSARLGRAEGLARKGLRRRNALEGAGAGNGRALGRNVRTNKFKIKRKTFQT